MTVDAILCADTHIRADTPRNRIDNFPTALQNKFEYILKLGTKYNCPILIAGDIGHRPTWPWPLYSWFIRVVKKYKSDIICIPGQHDLPNHKLDKMDDAPMGISAMTKMITVLDNGYKVGVGKINVFGFPFGKEIISPFDMVSDTKQIHALSGTDGLNRNIAITHQMVIEDRPEYKGQEGTKAVNLLKNNDYDLILSGDNHKPFVVQYKNKLLVNPGSMMRSNSDQAGHRPRVYLYDAENNKVVPEYLPIAKDVIKESVIDTEAYKKRFDAVIENLKEKQDQSVTIDFKENVKRYFENNRVRKNIKARVWEIIDSDDI